MVTPFTFPDLFPSAPAGGKNILYVDIGGSAIKWAVLPMSRSASDLIELLRAPSAPTLSRREWRPEVEGPQLVEILRGIVAGEPEFQGVALSMGGKDGSNPREYKGWLRKNCALGLAVEIEAAMGLINGSVRIVHDSFAWGRGIQNILSHDSLGAETTFGVLSFGTGVAFSTVSIFSVETFEASSGIYSWNRVRNADEFAPNNRWIHDHVGRPFFTWLEKQPVLPEERLSILNRRMQLFIDELSQHHRISQWFVSGGYGEQLAQCRFTQNVSVITESSYGFHPGFVPLIGLH